MIPNSRLRVTCDPSKKLIFATVLAPLNPSGLMKALNSMRAAPGFDQTMSVILDVHAAGLKNWSGDDVRFLSALVSQIEPDSCGKRLAVVENSDAGFGRLRMWQVHTNNAAPGERMVFRHLSEAAQWCRAREVASRTPELNEPQDHAKLPLIF